MCPPGFKYVEGKCIKEFVLEPESVKEILKEVDFDAFTGSSSFVGNVRYDNDSQEMVVILSGKEYNFCNVPRRKFDGFEGATSKGKFFNDEIKQQHDC